MGDLSFDSVIIIRYDNDEGRVVYDLGDVDEWSATTILRQVLHRVEDSLPDPRSIDEPTDIEDDD